jgi:predicted nucleic acid-binding protein
VRYADTSVLIPFYIDEPRSPDADALLTGAKYFCISDLSIAEFNVAVWRKVREGALTAAAAEVVFAAFDEHCAQGLYQIEAISRGHAATVRSFARELAQRSADPMRTLDALHAAICQQVGGTLLTFDPRLAAAARLAGLAVSS